MIWAILVFLFIAYSIGVFFISNWYIFAGIAAFHLLLMIILRVNILRAFLNLLIISPFIIFTGLFNWLFSDLENALLMTTRLVIVCNMTFIFATKIQIMKFVRGLGILLYPLRLIKVNTRHISVTVAIAITYIPIILDEHRRIKHAMHAKAKRRGIRLWWQIFMYKILYKAASMSRTLESKGYK
ncbi:MAG: energy-coupling factor transporter transmembrane protein EcfT [Firmicutes bacterium]|nr:energy-coupling factor transporter transmembrane protein EcfT [Bacillota bacterium]